MAEIPIRPQKRKIGWPWIVAMLIVLTAVVFLRFKNHEMNTNAESSTSRFSPVTKRVKLVTRWNPTRRIGYRNCLYIHYGQIPKKPAALIML